MELQVTIELYKTASELLRLRNSGEASPLKMEIFNKDKQGTKAAAAATPEPKPKNPKQITHDEMQEISKAVEKMDDQQVQKMIEIITQHCAEYRDMEDLELEIDDLPNDVQVILLEYVRRIFSNPDDKESDTSGSSKRVVIDLTDDDGTEEPQGSEQPNTSASRSDGATAASSSAPHPPKWTKAPLPPLRDKPAYVCLPAMLATPLLTVVVIVKEDR